MRNPNFARAKARAQNSGPPCMKSWIRSWVHTSLDCSILLSGKSRRGHSGNSQSKREHKVALLV